MSEGRRVLISGASGLVGTALCSALEERGHSVFTLSRRAGDFSWDPDVGLIDSDAFDGIDVVVHLAGESVAQRWTTEAKERILSSRVEGANLIVRELMKTDREIDFISASGINFYGYQSDAALDESSPQGSGFLARVCREWEAAADPLIEQGERCVLVRIGLVLAENGGALEKMLPPFKAGVGGRIGTGQQMMSWIMLDDLVRVFVRCIEDRSISGAVNAVAPSPVSNSAFTKAMGAVLRRPTFLPMPAKLVSAIFGEMAAETVLSNLSVYPRRLEEIGFDWKFPSVEEVLEVCVKR